MSDEKRRRFFGGATVGLHFVEDFLMSSRRQVETCPGLTVAIAEPRRAMIDGEDVRTPEQNLLAAVLCRAVNDAEGNMSGVPMGLGLKSPREIRLDAVEWLTSRKKDRWSARWVMEQLGYTDSMMKTIQAHGEKHRRAAEEEPTADEIKARRFNCWLAA